MVTLSDLEVSALCVLEHLHCRVECMVVNPKEGKVVLLDSETIELYPPQIKVTELGEPMGGIILWRTIDD